jgi:glutamate synthase domain-containing protein 2
MFRIQDELCTHCNFCGEGGPKLCYAARTALHGLEGNFPSKDDKKNTMFGHTQSAGEQYLPGFPRYKAMRDIAFMPELLGTDRVARKEQVGCEPLYTHCETTTMLGGFKVASPIVIAAMGSTPVANTIGQDLGMGAARGGFVYSIGENIVNMWGYDERVNDDQPTLVDRVRGFTDNHHNEGGVLIQQNVEDGLAGVWKRVYADPQFAELFDAGLIGFEAKGGQGAKPGMGGEVKIDRRKAQRLYKMYHFPVNPFDVEQSLYQRHSVPGTATPESMLGQLTEMCELYPKAQIWWKTGPYGDLMTQIEICDQVARKFNKRIHITIDGSEGGTGMSPLGPMNDMGLPMISCLLAVRRAKQRGYTNVDYSIAGGMVTGRDLAKSLAMGCDGIAFGKAFLIAAMAGRNKFAEDFAGEHALIEAGAKGVTNYAIEGATNEARMLISSVGRYHFDAVKPGEPYVVDGQRLSTIDVIALDEKVAAMFDLLYAYDPELWQKLDDVTAELRRRCAEAAMNTAGA